MFQNGESKRTTGGNGLVSVESIGSTIFLILIACFCFLVIVMGLSRIQAHSTDDVFGPNRRAKAERVTEPAPDLCGVPAPPETQAP